MNAKHFLPLIVFTLMFFSQIQFCNAFRIVANIKPSEMPDGTLGYTYVQRYDSQSHVLIEEPNTFELNLRKELSMLDSETFDKIFDKLHDGTYTFTLTRVEPKSFRKNEDESYRCTDRCNTGPKAELILTLPDGRHNDPNFKAAIDKVARDWISFGALRYAITNIEVEDFYENYIGEKRYYLPEHSNARVVVDFCIIFGYLNEQRRIVIPRASKENCVESIDELLAFLATEYTEDIASSTGDVLVSEGRGLSKARCDIDFETESEYLEVKARPKEDNWARVLNGKKFDMFEVGVIAKSRGPTLNLAGLRAEDTGNALFDSAYKFDLISFSPKILTPEGSIVERKGIPDADIEITEVSSGEKRHSRMDYHTSESELEAKYSFGGKKSIVLRLYQDPAEIEMPYFVDEQGNNCSSGCTLHEGVHCKDAYVRFAMKVRLFENEERYSWFMKTKREVQRLAEGPNLNITVSDTSGNILGMGNAAQATVSFNDPVTGELYSLTKDVLGGKVSFYVPISVTDDVPVTLTITAFGYQPYNETFILDSEPYEKTLNVQLVPAGGVQEPSEGEEVLVSTKYVVFSYAAFKTLVENYVPYFTEPQNRQQYPAVGDDLTSYPKDSYVAVYEALRDNKIFKLVDPESGQEVPYSLNFNFTGTTEYKGKEIPLDVVIELDNISLNKIYEARFFLPVPSRLAGSTVDSYKDLKVVTVNWRFTASGLIESNWQTRDAQQGEW